MGKRSRSSNDARPGGAAKKRRTGGKSAYIRSARASNKLAPETKYFDTTWNATVDSSADWATSTVAMTSYIQSDGVTVGAYTDRALIPSAVGSGYGQVVGSKYLLKKVALKGEIVSSAASDQADMLGSRTCRVVLVMDTQPNGAQATGDLLFTDLGNATQCNHSFIAMGSSGNGRFRVLKDKTYLLQPMVAGTDGANTNSVINGGAIVKMSWNPKKALPIRIKSNSATPTIASLTDCNIFMLAHMSTTSPGFTFTGAARAYYVD